jgi:aspartate aminotransferase-like enzyme
LKGKIFRLAHLGNYGELDLIQVIAAVEMTLGDLGHAFSAGAGVAAAMQVFRG